MFKSDIDAANAPASAAYHESVAAARAPARAAVYGGQVCQGDVLIERCDPSHIEGLKETKPTVALGEATGHHHTYDGKHATGFFKEGDTGEPMAGGTALADFVKIVGESSALRHQEHAPIVHEPGTYERTPQMAWTSEMIVPAAD